MKITNKTLVNSVVALNSLAEQSLPVKAAYRVSKIMRKLNNAVEDYNKVLGGLQKKYSELDEDGQIKTENNQIVFKDAEGFFEEHGTLLDIEVELDVEKFKIEDLGELELKPAVLFQLDWLIEELE